MMRFPHQKGLKLVSDDGEMQAGAVMGKWESSPGPGFMGGEEGELGSIACLLHASVQQRKRRKDGYIKLLQQRN